MWSAPVPLGIRGLPMHSWHVGVNGCCCQLLLYNAVLHFLYSAVLHFLYSAVLHFLYSAVLHSWADSHALLSCAILNEWLYLCSVFSFFFSSYGWLADGSGLVGGGGGQKGGGGGLKADLTVNSGDQVDRHRVAAQDRASDGADVHPAGRGWGAVPQAADVRSGQLWGQAGHSAGGCLCLRACQKGGGGNPTICKSGWVSGVGGGGGSV